MDNKSLLCFKKVAETQHLTKAAKELFISQAQLSRIIADLEDEFGVKFFDRDNKGFRLNQCGRVFYDYATQFLNLYDKTGRHVRESYLHEQAQILIVTNVPAYMPHLLGPLNNALSDSTFSCRTLSHRKCEALLKQGTADFAIVCPGINDIDIKQYLLRREDGIVIYPKDHWLAGRSHVSLTELENEKFIGESEGYGTRGPIDGAFRRCGITPRFIVESHEWNIVTQCVSEGLGISIVPRATFINDPVFKNRYADIDEKVAGNVYLAYPAHKKLSDRDNIVVDTVVDYFSSFAQKD